MLGNLQSSTIYPLPVISLSALLFSLLFITDSVLADSEKQWLFRLTPVLWNASVDATLSDDDSSGELPIDPEYRFFSLDNLDDYLSLKFEANHDRWGFLFDSLRARYQDETANKLVNFHVATELGFIEAAVRYQLSIKQNFDLIAGVRHSFLNIDQTIRLPVVPDEITHYKFNWTDPVVGIRYHHSLSDHWIVWLHGDIGGFNVATQRMLNFTADMQYLISTHFSFTFGYRYLEIDFKEDDVLYDVTLDGIQFGLGIHF